MHRLARSYSGLPGHEREHGWWDGDMVCRTEEDAVAAGKLKSQHLVGD